MIAFDWDTHLTLLQMADDAFTGKVDPPSVEPDPPLPDTFDVEAEMEAWAEYLASEPCCATPQVAAANLCGCGGKSERGTW